MTSAFLPGFALSLTLILAIGAQNAFVLRQGLKQQHVFWVCATCALSDALLIAAGVAGFGALGVAFLIWYGAQNALSAWRGGEALTADGGASRSLYHTILTLLALTWLNPHVYLDTVVLLGSISAQYQDRLAFGIGAVSASFIFFFGLGYGARLLTPLFAKPRSWQILDMLIALTMWAIAVKLLLM